MSFISWLSSDFEMVATIKVTLRDQILTSKWFNNCIDNNHHVMQSNIYLPLRLIVFQDSAKIYHKAPDTDI